MTEQRDSETTVGVNDQVADAHRDQRRVTALQALLTTLTMASDRLSDDIDTPAGLLPRPVAGQSGEAVENQAIHRSRAAMARADAQALAVEVDDLRGRVHEVIERTALLADGADRYVGLRRDRSQERLSTADCSRDATAQSANRPLTTRVRAGAELTTCGRIGDAEVAAALLEMAEGLLAGGVTELRLDLSSLDHIGHEFLRTLATVNTTAQSSACEVVVTEVQNGPVRAAVAHVAPVALPSAARPLSSLEPASVRRAVAFIEEHAQEPIGIADIAAVARIGQRGLQHAFRIHRATTPMAYLKVARLHGAHLDLERADSTSGVTVARIAARWRFSNPGRFAIEYSHMFGHHPSATLRA